MLLHGIRLSREYSDIFSVKAMEEIRMTKDPCLRIFVTEARSIKSRTDEEAKLIEHMFTGLRIYNLILSVPGFGRVSVAYLASLIIDVNRFGTRNEFTAYFGIVPRMRKSAELSHRFATTHCGDEAARRLLCQAAFVHVNTVEDSVVTHMYSRLKGMGMAYREVQVACARKLLTVVLSVLKNFQGRSFMRTSAWDSLTGIIAEHMLSALASAEAGRTKDCAVPDGRRTR